VHLISKSFKFDAAHRLVDGYKGKCSNVHGHSWVVTIHLQSDRLDKFGMVRDFNDLKVIKNWIDKWLDHACIVADSDKYLTNWLDANKQKKYTVKGNPTSEKLSQVIFDMCHEQMVPVYAVDISETCTSSARYEP